MADGERGKGGGNLVLSRKEGEAILIRMPGGKPVWVCVARIERDKVRLALHADLSVEFTREELLPVEERRYG